MDDRDSYGDGRRPNALPVVLALWIPLGLLVGIAMICGLWNGIRSLAAPHDTADDWELSSRQRSVPPAADGDLVSPNSKRSWRSELHR